MSTKIIVNRGLSNQWEIDADRWEGDGQLVSVLDARGQKFHAVRADTIVTLDAEGLRPPKAE